MCSRYDAIGLLSFLTDFLPHLDPSDIPDGPDGLVSPGLETLIWANSQPVRARFGLIPRWHTGPVKDFKATTFNARIETVADKPAFKEAWRKGRAVVGANAFYEWDGPPSARRKWRVTRSDGQPLIFAALWEQANCAGLNVNCFALLSQAAGKDMSAIHDREPIILDPSQVEDWLNGDTPAAHPALTLTPQFRAEPQQASLF